MLENLRRKSLVKTYIDPTHLVRFEQGHAVYLDSFSIAQHKQKLSTKKVDKPFPSIFDGISKELRLIANTLGDVQFNMIYCPKDTFTMGHKDQAGNPPREETIGRPFLLGETEVTQELFQAVMNFNPSAFQGQKYPNSNQRPVECVTWYDAVMFCNKLSLKLGNKPYYNISNVNYANEKEKELSNIQSTDVTINPNSNGYRLPEEKEWEYAAKAGTQNRWAGTNNKNKLKEYAWFTGGYWDGSTHPVATKLPNEWGFYDMSGNVWEWCWDIKNPNIDANRVIRGGSWSCIASDLSSATRYGPSPGRRNYNLGFRVCRSIVN